MCGSVHTVTVWWDCSFFLITDILWDYLKLSSINLPFKI